MLTRVLPLLAVLLLAPLAPSGRAQGGFTRYGIADGLPTLSVADVAQDAQGFIWMGTEEGLARFDGHRVQAFRAHPGDTTALGDNVAVVVAAAAQGGVWTWTSPGGLQRYDPRAGHFVRAPAAPLAASSMTIVDDLLDDGAQVWVGSGQGLWRFTPRTGRTERVPGLPMRVRRLALAGGGAVWALADGRLYYVPARGPLRSVALPPEAGTPTAVHLGSGGAVVVGTDQGVLAAEPGQPFGWRLRTPGAVVTALQTDADGGLWVGTQRGLWHLPTAATAPVYFAHAPGNPASLPISRVNGLLVDRTGTLWVALPGGGLAARPTQPSPFQLFVGPGGPEAPSVRALERTRAGDLWLGSLSGELCRARPGLPCQQRIETTLPHGQVIAMATLPDGVRVVAVRADGLRCLLPGRPTLQRCPGAPAAMGVVRDVLVTRGGTLYVAGGDSGVYRRHDGRWTRLPLPPRTASTAAFAWLLAEAPDGDVWIGTYNAGLYRFRPATGRLTAETAGPALRTLALAFTPDSSLWAGTMGAGLVRLKRGQVEHFGAAHGLTDGAVPNLIADARGRLWAFTDAGAFRFDAPTRRFTLFGPRDGFPPVHVHSDVAARDPAGRLYIGSASGYVVFDPEAVGQQETVPAVHLSAVSINGAVREPNALFLDRLRLPHTDNVLAVDVATDVPGPVRPWRYSYRLAGADDERQRWQPLSATPRIELGALTPGRYTLYVRTQEGTRVGPARALGLTITPPFWRTGWFQTLAVLVLAAFFYGLYRYRLAQLLRVERARRRIADDLHDDLGTKLSTLATQLEVSGQYGPQDAAPTALLGFAAQTRTLVGDLRDTVWVIDGQRDTLASLTDRLETTAYNLLGPDRFRFARPDTLPEVPLPMEQRRHLFLLLKEALHNAHRHAAPAAVRLSVEATEAEARFTVEDAGPGFDLAAAPTQGNGLGALRRRAEAARVHLHVQSAPGAGTRVQVTLPLPDRARRGAPRLRRTAP